jgi:hypothetical protein
MAGLRVGLLDIEVEASLLELATARCSFTPFLAERGLSSGLKLERRSQLYQGDALDGVDASLGVYVIEGETLAVQVPDNPFAAEAALKAAFALAVWRQGGLLVHGSAVRFKQGVVAALGPSGAGKSTLARWCRAAGGELLSDETLGLLPGGRVLGSPFRSDDDMVGTCREGTLLQLLTLRHGDVERLDPIDKREAVQRILAQVYQLKPVVGLGSELLPRASLLADNSPMALFTCRNHPDAGHFWARRAQGQGSSKGVSGDS